MGNKRYKFSRYAMYEHVEKALIGENLTKGKTLVIGGNNPAIQEMLPEDCSITLVDHPAVDIHDMVDFRSGSFKYVIADQVLEHVMRPWVAVEEVRRVLRKGGLAILTSCMIHPIHKIPGDYWRFTPNGLEVLCENFSDVVTYGGSGDLQMAIACLRGGRGQRVVPGKEIEKRAMANDDKHFMQTWIIAKK